MQEPGNLYHEHWGCLHAGQALRVVPASAQVVEDGYEFFAKRQLVTIFSAPNYCGEFDNAGAMMSVDETLMCSFQARSTVLQQRNLGRAQ